MRNPSPPRGRRTKKARWKGPAIIILVLLVWSGLVYGGFYLGKDYIDRSVKNVQETNAMNVQALEEELKSIRGEMKEIETALNQADKQLSSTDATREKLNRKIEQLDKQLKQLQKSLQILRETGNVEY